MAGHDVLAVTIRAVLYHVARNPPVEAKLRAELANVAHFGVDIVPYAELQKLTYLYDEKAFSPPNYSFQQVTDTQSLCLQGCRDRRVVAYSWQLGPHQ